MRIIAGVHRSRLLKMVSSKDTRETSDKVRGAVFNSLADQVEHAEILDLFAGSGAYGLEALSRGAATVLFNDVKPDAVKTIKENVSALKEDSASTIWQLDYQDAIKRIQAEGRKFDIVFLDPPYQLDVYEEVISALGENVVKAGIVVAEMHKDRIINLESVSGFTLYKERTYGIKKINYYIKN